MATYRLEALRAGSLTSKMSLGVGEQLRVLSHPLRLRMLSLLMVDGLSAAQLGRTIGISQASASYHLRRLEAAGLVEFVEERPRRGGRERVFRHREEQPLELSGAEREGFMQAALAEARRRLADIDVEALSATADAELWVDPEVHARLDEQARLLAREMHEHARPARTPGARRLSLTLLLFAMRAADD